MKEEVKRISASHEPVLACGGNVRFSESFQVWRASIPNRNESGTDPGLNRRPKAHFLIFIMPTKSRMVSRYLTQYRSSPELRDLKWDWATIVRRVREQAPATQPLRGRHKVEKDASGQSRD